MIGTPLPSSTDTQPRDGATADPPELLLRLLGPDGAAEKARILQRLVEIERQLSAQAEQLQSPERMRLVDTARLAVAEATSIMNRVVVDQ